MQSDSTSVRFATPGSLHPVLSLFIQPITELPFELRTGKPVDRWSRLVITSLSIAGLRAIYVSSPSDAIESLHLPYALAPSGSGQTVLTLLYRPATAEAVHPDPLFMTISHSLSFKAVSESGSEVSSGSAHVISTGSGAINDGNPCGGTAGILCPAGEYCAVADRESNVGRCRKL